MQAWVLDLASSPWLYLVMYLLATIDGFFPPVPSESVIIAIATLAAANGTPNILFVIVAAAAGAFCGDQIAYTIGTRVNVRQLRFMRGEKAQAALDWADHSLANHGAAFIFAARYVPIGRVAVNMTAGSLAYPRRRFVGLTIASGITWAVYSALIGMGAARVLGHNPVVAVLVGVTGGIVMGVIVDHVLRWVMGRRRPVEPNGTAEPERVS